MNITQTKNTDNNATCDEYDVFRFIRGLQEVFILEGGVELLKRAGIEVSNQLNEVAA